MSSSNPYHSPAGGARSPQSPSGPNAPLDDGRVAYNVVTDVVTGPNLRWKDNLFQAVVILLAIPLGAGIGYVVATDKPLGALVGGGGGLLAGLFGSGIILMIWRLVRHARGKHD